MSNVFIKFYYKWEAFASCQSRSQVSCLKSRVWKLVRIKWLFLLLICINNVAVCGSNALVKIWYFFNQGKSILLFYPWSKKFLAPELNLKFIAGDMNEIKANKNMLCISMLKFQWLVTFSSYIKASQYKF